MFAMLVITSALLALRQETPAAKHADPAILDQLIERSRAVKSFSATYRLTTSDSEGVQAIRFDYREPSNLRVDFQVDGVETHMWSIGDVLDQRGEVDGKPIDVHVDLGALRAELRPIEELLDHNFPVVRPTGTQRRGVAVFDWSYDSKTNKNKWNMAVAVFDEAETTFGWLATIKKKQAALVEDGEHLKCTTDDGRFEIVVSKTTGFVQRLFSRKPDSSSTFTIELESLAVDQPVEAARFEVPALATDPQASAKQVEWMERTVRAALRERTWKRAAAACGGAEVEPELRGRFESTLKPLQELMCHAQYDSLMARTREHIAQVVEYVRQKDEAGSSDDELDELREKYREGISAALDKTEDSSRAIFEVPPRAATASCAPRLLVIEKELAQAIFRDLVRQPLLDEFDRATKTD